MVDSSLLAGGILHFASRKLLLWKLIREKNCRAISLISQELFLVMYICRYLDLLYLYVSFSNTIVKVLHLCIALAIVMLMRYSPQVAATYDADLDTFPRSVLIIPCFVLAILYHKVALVMEICRTASAYLEALVLIPQFVLMYKRQAYETWVLVFVVLAGGEHVVASIMSFLHWSDAMRTDPYYAVSAGVQAVVFLVGLLLLLLQKVQLRSAAGLNEAEKPAFDEVWEASKFSFDDTEAQKQAAAAAGQQGGGGTAGIAHSK